MSNILDNFPAFEVRESFNELKALLSELIAALASQHPNYPCWVAAPDDDSRQEKNAALWVYQQLFYQPGQDKRSTVIRPGFLATTEDTIQLAKKLNLAKTRFKNAMQKIKQKPARLALSMDLFDQSMRDSNQAKVLKKAGLGTLHLKQVYRHIPILDVEPKRLGFSWSKGSQLVEKLTIDEALNFVFHLPNNNNALTLLNKLESGESIARVRSHVPHVRVNVVLPDHAKPKQMTGSIPVLFASVSLEEPLFTSIPYNPDDVVNTRLPRETSSVNYNEPIIFNAENTIGLYFYNH